MNDSLSTYIRRYIEITDEELRLFQSYLTQHHFKKKAFILEAGKVCRARYFILEGCVRCYYDDQKGNEQITHFGIENWWITDYDSLLNKRPSRQSIQTIEATTLLALSEQDLEKVYCEIPKMERFFRIIMERTYIAAQRRLEFMFSLTAEEMYDVFFEGNSAFTQRIPQYMLASYLGFSPEFLSKIRKKRSKNNS